MSCEPYLDLISARLDDALTPEQAQQLSAHMQVCPACRAIAKDLENMHSALTGCEVPAPAQLSQQVMAQIRREKRTRRRTLRQLGALAACFVLCAGAYWLTGENLPAVGADLPIMVRTGTDEQTPLPYTADEPDSCSFTNEQVLSVSYSSAPEAPEAVILDSVQSLSDFAALFPQDDLSALTAAYGEEFFRDNRLLAVVVEEPSSSITHSIAEVTPDTVTVARRVPQAGDCDMALWLILAELNGAGTGDVLNVEFISK